MNIDDIYSIISLIISFIMFSLPLCILCIPPTEKIENASIVEIHNKGTYYTYDVKTNTTLLHDIISTNYYELDSNHTVYYMQNVFGIPFDGKFI